MSKSYKKGEFSLFPVAQLIGLTPYQQVTMAWLIHHANASGKCFPSLKKLCEETGIGKTKLVKVLAELDEMGLISKKNRSDGNGRLSNLYTVYKCKPKTQVSRGELRVGREAVTNYNQVEQNPSSPASAENIESVKNNSNQQPSSTVAKKEENTSSAPSAEQAFIDEIWGDLNAEVRARGGIVASKKAEYVKFFSEVGDITLVKKVFSYLRSPANINDAMGWKNAAYNVGNLRNKWNLIVAKATRQTHRLCGEAGDYV